MTIFNQHHSYPIRHTTKRGRTRIGDPTHKSIPKFFYAIINSNKQQHQKQQRFYSILCISIIIKSRPTPISPPSSIEHQGTPSDGCRENVQTVRVGSSPGAPSIRHSHTPQPTHSTARTTAHQLVVHFASFAPQAAADYISLVFRTVSPHCAHGVQLHVLPLAGSVPHHRRRRIQRNKTEERKQAEETTGLFPAFSICLAPPIGRMPQTVGITLPGRGLQNQRRAHQARETRHEGAAAVPISGLSNSRGMHEAHYRHCRAIPAHVLSTARGRAAPSTTATSQLRWLARSLGKHEEEAGREANKRERKDKGQDKSNRRAPSEANSTGPGPTLRAGIGKQCSTNAHGVEQSLYSILCISIIIKSRPTPISPPSSIEHQGTPSDGCRENVQTVRVGSSPGAPSIRHSHTPQPTHSTARTTAHQLVVHFASFAPQAAADYISLVFRTVSPHWLPGTHSDTAEPHTSSSRTKKKKKEKERVEEKEKKACQLRDCSPVNTVVKARMAFSFTCCRWQDLYLIIAGVASKGTRQRKESKQKKQPDYSRRSAYVSPLRLDACHRQSASPCPEEACKINGEHTKRGRRGTRGRSRADQWVDVNIISARAAARAIPAHVLSTGEPCGTQHYGYKSLGKHEEEAGREANKRERKDKGQDKSNRRAPSEANSTGPGPTLRAGIGKQCSTNAHGVEQSLYSILCISIIIKSRPTPISPPSSIEHQGTPSDGCRENVQTVRVGSSPGAPSIRHSHTPQPTHSTARTTAHQLVVHFASFAPQAAADYISLVFRTVSPHWLPGTHSDTAEPHTSSSRTKKKRRKKKGAHGVQLHVLPLAGSVPHHRRRRIQRNKTEERKQAEETTGLFPAFSICLALRLTHATDSRHHPARKRLAKSTESTPSAGDEARGAAAVPISGLSNSRGMHEAHYRHCRAIPAHVLPPGAVRHPALRLQVSYGGWLEAWESTRKKREEKQTRGRGKTKGKIKATGGHHQRQTARAQAQRSAQGSASNAAPTHTAWSRSLGGRRIRNHGFAQLTGRHASSSSQAPRPSPRRAALNIRARRQMVFLDSLQVSRSSSVAKMCKQFALDHHPAPRPSVTPTLHSPPTAQLAPRRISCSHHLRRKQPLTTSRSCFVPLARIGCRERIATQLSRTPAAAEQKKKKEKERVEEKEKKACQLRDCSPVNTVVKARMAFSFTCCRWQDLYLIIAGVASKGTRQRKESKQKKQPDYSRRSAYVSPLRLTHATDSRHHPARKRLAKSTESTPSAGDEARGAAAVPISGLSNSRGMHEAHYRLSLPTSSPPGSRAAPSTTATSQLRWLARSLGKHEEEAGREANKRERKDKGQDKSNRRAPSEANSTGPGPTLRAGIGKQCSTNAHGVEQSLVWPRRRTNLIRIHGVSLGGRRIRNHGFAQLTGRHASSSSQAPRPSPRRAALNIRARRQMVFLDSLQVSRSSSVAKMCKQFALIITRRPVHPSLPHSTAHPQHSSHHGASFASFAPQAAADYISLVFRTNQKKKEKEKERVEEKEKKACQLRDCSPVNTVVKARMAFSFTCCRWQDLYLIIAGVASKGTRQRKESKQKKQPDYSRRSAYVSPSDWTHATDSRHHPARKRLAKSTESTPSAGDEARGRSRADQWVDVNIISARAAARAIPAHVLPPGSRAAPSTTATSQLRWLARSLGKHEEEAGREANKRERKDKGQDKSNRRAPSEANSTGPGPTLRAGIGKQCSTNAHGVEQSLYSILCISIIIKSRPTPISPPSSIEHQGTPSDGCRENVQTVRVRSSPGAPSIRRSHTPQPTHSTARTTAHQLVVHFASFAPQAAADYISLVFRTVSPHWLPGTHSDTAEPHTSSSRTKKKKKEKRVEKRKEACQLRDCSPVNTVVKARMAFSFTCCRWQDLYLIIAGVASKGTRQRKKQAEETTGLFRRSAYVSPLRLDACHRQSASPCPEEACKINGEHTKRGRRGTRAAAVPISGLSNSRGMHEAHYRHCRSDGLSLPTSSPPGGRAAPSTTATSQLRWLARSLGKHEEEAGREANKRERKDKGQDKSNRRAPSEANSTGPGPTLRAGIGKQCSTNARRGAEPRRRTNLIRIHGVSLGGRRIRNHGFAQLTGRHASSSSQAPPISPPSSIEHQGTPSDGCRENVQTVRVGSSPGAPSIRRSRTPQRTSTAHPQHSSHHGASVGSAFRIICAAAADYISLVFRTVSPHWLPGTHSDTAEPHTSSSRTKKKKKEKERVEEKEKRANSEIVHPFTCCRWQDLYLIIAGVASKGTRQRKASRRNNRTIPGVQHMSRPSDWTHATDSRHHPARKRLAKSTESTPSAGDEARGAAAVPISGLSNSRGMHEAHYRHCRSDGLSLPTSSPPGGRAAPSTTATSQLRWLARSLGKHEEEAGREANKRERKDKGQDKSNRRAPSEANSTGPGPTLRAGIGKQCSTNAHGVEQSLVWSLVSHTTRNPSTHTHSQPATGHGGARTSSSLGGRRIRNHGFAQLTGRHASSSSQAPRPSPRRAALNIRARRQMVFLDSLQVSRSSSVAKMCKQFALDHHPAPRPSVAPTPQHTTAHPQHSSHHGASFASFAPQAAADYISLVFRTSLKRAWRSASRAAVGRICTSSSPASHPKEQDRGKKASRRNNRTIPGVQHMSRPSDWTHATDSRHHPARKRLAKSTESTPSAGDEARGAAAVPISGLSNSRGMHEAHYRHCRSDGLSLPTSSPPGGRAAPSTTATSQLRWLARSLGKHEEEAGREANKRERKDKGQDKSNRRAPSEANSTGPGPTLRAGIGKQCSTNAHGVEQSLYSILCISIIIKSRPTPISPPSSIEHQGTPSDGCRENVQTVRVGSSPGAPSIRRSRTPQRTLLPTHSTARTTAHQLVVHFASFAPQAAADYISLVFRTVSPHWLPGTHSDTAEPHTSSSRTKKKKKEKERVEEKEKKACQLRDCSPVNTVVKARMAFSFTCCRWQDLYLIIAGVASKGTRQRKESKQKKQPDYSRRSAYVSPLRLDACHRQSASPCPEEACKINGEHTKRGRRGTRAAAVPISGLSNSRGMHEAHYRHCRSDGLSLPTSSPPGGRAAPSTTATSQLRWLARSLGKHEEEAGREANKRERKDKGQDKSNRRAPSEANSTGPGPTLRAGIGKQCSTNAHGVEQSLVWSLVSHTTRNPSTHTHTAGHRPRRRTNLIRIHGVSLGGRRIRNHGFAQLTGRHASSSSQAPRPSPRRAALNIRARRQMVFLDSLQVSRSSSVAKMCKQFALDHHPAPRPSVAPALHSAHTAHPQHSSHHGASFASFAPQAAADYISLVFRTVSPHWLPGTHSDTAEPHTSSSRTKKEGKRKRKACQLRDCSPVNTVVKARMAFSFTCCRWQDLYLIIAGVASKGTRQRKESKQKKQPDYSRRSAYVSPLRLDACHRHAGDEARGAAAVPISGLSNSRGMHEAHYRHCRSDGLSLPTSSPPGGRAAPSTTATSQLRWLARSLGKHEEEAGREANKRERKDKGQDKSNRRAPSEANSTGPGPTLRAGIGKQCSTNAHGVEQSLVWSLVSHTTRNPSTHTHSQPATGHGGARTSSSLGGRRIRNHGFAQLTGRHASSSSQAPRPSPRRAALNIRARRQMVFLDSLQVSRSSSVAKMCKQFALDHHPAPRPSVAPALHSAHSTAHPQHSSHHGASFASFAPQAAADYISLVFRTVSPHWLPGTHSDTAEPHTSSSRTKKKRRKKKGGGKGKKACQLRDCSPVNTVVKARMAFSFTCCRWQDLYLIIAGVASKGTRQRKESKQKKQPDYSRRSAYVSPLRLDACHRQSASPCPEEACKINGEHTKRGRRGTRAAAVPISGLSNSRGMHEAHYRHCRSDGLSLPTSSPPGGRAAPSTTATSQLRWLARSLGKHEEEAGREANKRERKDKGQDKSNRRAPSEANSTGPGPTLRAGIGKQCSTNAHGVEQSLPATGHGGARTSSSLGGRRIRNHGFAQLTGRHASSSSQAPRPSPRRAALNIRARRQMVFLDSLQVSRSSSVAKMCKQFALDHHPAPRPSVAPALHSAHSTAHPQHSSHHGASFASFAPQAAADYISLVFRTVSPHWLPGTHSDTAEPHTSSSRTKKKKKEKERVEEKEKKACQLRDCSPVNTVVKARMAFSFTCCRWQDLYLIIAGVASKGTRQRKESKQKKQPDYSRRSAYVSPLRLDACHRHAGDEARGAAAVPISGLSNSRGMHEAHYRHCRSDGLSLPTSSPPGGRAAPSTTATSQLRWLARSLGKHEEEAGREANKRERKDKGQDKSNRRAPSEANSTGPGPTLRAGIGKQCSTNAHGVEQSLVWSLVSHTTRNPSTHTHTAGHRPRRRTNLIRIHGVSLGGRRIRNHGFAQLTGRHASSSSQAPRPSPRRAALNIRARRQMVFLDSLQVSRSSSVAKMCKQFALDHHPAPRPSVAPALHSAHSTAHPQHSSHHGASFASFAPQAAADYISLVFRTVSPHWLPGTHSDTAEPHTSSSRTKKKRRKRKGGGKGKACQLRDCSPVNTVVKARMAFSFTCCRWQDLYLIIAGVASKGTRQRKESKQKKQPDYSRRSAYVSPLRLDACHRQSASPCPEEACKINGEHTKRGRRGTRAAAVPISGLSNSRGMHEAHYRHCRSDGLSLPTSSPPGGRAAPSTTATSQLRWLARSLGKHEEEAGREANKRERKDKGQDKSNRRAPSEANSTGPGPTLRAGIGKQCSTNAHGVEQSLVWSLVSHTTRNPSTHTHTAGHRPRRRTNLIRIHGVSLGGRRIRNHGFAQLTGRHASSSSQAPRPSPRRAALNIRARRQMVFLDSLQVSRSSSVAKMCKQFALDHHPAPRPSVAPALHSAHSTAHPQHSSHHGASFASFAPQAAADYISLVFRTVSPHWLPGTHSDTAEPHTSSSRTKKKKKEKERVEEKEKKACQLRDCSPVNTVVKARMAFSFTCCRWQDLYLIIAGVASKGTRQRKESKQKKQPDYSRRSAYVSPLRLDACHRQSASPCPEEACKINGEHTKRGRRGTRAAAVPISGLSNSRGMHEAHYRHCRSDGLSLPTSSPPGGRAAPSTTATSQLRWLARSLGKHEEEAGREANKRERKDKGQDKSNRRAPSEANSTGPGPTLRAGIGKQCSTNAHGVEQSLVWSLVSHTTRNPSTHTHTAGHRPRRRTNLIRIHGVSLGGRRIRNHGFAQLTGRHASSSSQAPRPSPRRAALNIRARRQMVFLDSLQVSRSSSVAKMCKQFALDHHPAPRPSVTPALHSHTHSTARTTAHQLVVHFASFAPQAAADYISLVFRTVSPHWLPGTHSDTAEPHTSSSRTKKKKGKERVEEKEKRANSEIVHPFTCCRWQDLYLIIAGVASKGTRQRKESKQKKQPDYSRRSAYVSPLRLDACHRQSASPCPEEACKINGEHTKRGRRGTRAAAVPISGLSNSRGMHEAHYRHCRSDGLSLPTSSPPGGRAAPSTTATSQLRWLARSLGKHEEEAGREANKRERKDKGQDKSNRRAPSEANSTGPGPTLRAGIGKQCSTNAHGVEQSLYSILCISIIIKSRPTPISPPSSIEHQGTPSDGCRENVQTVRVGSSPGAPSIRHSTAHTPLPTHSTARTTAHQLVVHFASFAPQAAADYISLVFRTVSPHWLPGTHSDTAEPHTSSSRTKKKKKEKKGWRKGKACQLRDCSPVNTVVKARMAFSFTCCRWQDLYLIIAGVASKGTRQRKESKQKKQPDYSRRSAYVSPLRLDACHRQSASPCPEEACKINGEHTKRGRRGTRAAAVPISGLSNSRGMHEAHYRHCRSDGLSLPTSSPPGGRAAPSTTATSQLRWLARSLGKHEEEAGREANKRERKDKGQDKSNRRAPSEANSTGPGPTLRAGIGKQCSTNAHGVEQSLYSILCISIIIKSRPTPISPPSSIEHQGTPSDGCRENVQTVRVGSSPGAPSIRHSRTPQPTHSTARTTAHQLVVHFASFAPQAAADYISLVFRTVSPHWLPGTHSDTAEPHTSSSRTKKKRRKRKGGGKGKACQLRDCSPVNTVVKARMAFSFTCCRWQDLYLIIAGVASKGTRQRKESKQKKQPDYSRRSAYVSPLRLDACHRQSASPCPEEACKINGEHTKRGRRGTRAAAVPISGLSNSRGMHEAHYRHCRSDGLSLPTSSPPRGRAAPSTTATSQLRWLARSLGKHEEEAGREANKRERKDKGQDKSNRRAPSEANSTGPGPTLRAGIGKQCSTNAHGVEQSLVWSLVSHTTRNPSTHTHTAGHRPRRRTNLIRIHGVSLGGRRIRNHGFAQLTGRHASSSSQAPRPSPRRAALNIRARRQMVFLDSLQVSRSSSVAKMCKLFALDHHPAPRPSVTPTLHSAHSTAHPQHSSQHGASFASFAPQAAADYISLVFRTVSPHWLPGTHSDTAEPHTSSSRTKKKKEGKRKGGRKEQEGSRCLGANKVLKVLDLDSGAAVGRICSIIVADKIKETKGSVRGNSTGPYSLFTPSLVSSLSLLLVLLQAFNIIIMIFGTQLLLLLWNITKPYTVQQHP
eukprot:gene4166-3007_t